MRLSNAARVALAPAATYAALAASRADASWARALAGPLLAGLVLGTSLSIAATHVASLTAAIGVAVFWSFVPAVQLMTALIVCRRAPRRKVTLPRAIELLFLGHLPYSLWLLAFAGSTFVLAPGPALMYWLLATLAVPVAWTPLLIARFSSEVLGCTPRDARRRATLHQVLTWTGILTLALLAAQPWARVGGGS